MRGSTRLHRAREQRANTPTSTKPDLLPRIEAYVRIFSAIFIPIAIAFTGWWVQSSVAEATIKKDYVAMAMGILKEGKADPEMITWASEVIRQNSPTPLSNQLQAKIINATLSASKVLTARELPTPPKGFMEAPKELTKLPSKKELASGTITTQRIFDQWLDDRQIAQQNAITLKYLQEWVLRVQERDREIREITSKIYTDSILKEQAIEKKFSR